MTDRKNQPIAQKAYDALAEAYAERIDTKPHNADDERPATLSLLPEVNGKRILDAGCGPGVYAEWLVLHGADVVAMDANTKMVALAKQRLGEKVQVLQANLESPLDFLAEASFDVVVSALVMDYVKDWEPVLCEFHRVLKPGGCLVFSMEHPYMKYATHHLMSNYFKVERVEYVWRGFGEPVTVPSYRRPLRAVVNPLLKAGFILEQLLEPIPTEEFWEKDPEEDEALMRCPDFMGVRAGK